MKNYKVSNYETDDKAELMKKNFGDEGEDTIHLGED